MADITTNQASNPLRRATSFYDFSSLESNNGGATAPNVPLATGGKPNDDEAGGEGNGTPANGGTPAGGTTPATSEAGGGSTKTTTTTTVQANPYAQFHGNNYEDLEKFIRSRMDELPPDETKEERVKRERREKQQGFLARLADGLGSFHTTFAYARGEKPMDMPQMSKRATELYEKAKAAREKNRDLRLNYALTLANLRDKDRDFNFRVAQTEQQQGNWQKQFDAGRKDRADDVEFRDKQYADGRKDRADDVAFRDKQFEEGKREFNINAAETKRAHLVSESFERRRIAASQDGKYTEFYTGNGMIKIPNTRLNQHNISYIFSRTPANGRPTDSHDWQTGKTTPVTADQMMTWIGSNIDDPNVQSALRAIGGVTTKADNTPPSRRNNDSNTPPSRRDK